MQHNFFKSLHATDVIYRHDAELPVLCASSMWHRGVNFPYVNNSCISTKKISATAEIKGIFATKYSTGKDQWRSTKM
jgi:hypothetical protein